MNKAPAATATKKSAIVRAAVKVFAAHGFDAGTIRQIATEAGVAEGLIYHYFDSKEALLDAVIRERSILPWLDDPNALPEDLPVEVALRELVAEGLSRMMRHADMFAVVWSQVATNAALADRVGRVFREITDRVAGYLDRKIARGELRPVDTGVAARMLAASLITFIIAQHRLSPPLKHVSPQHYADQVVGILLDGLADRAGPATAEEGGDTSGSTTDVE